MFLEDILSAHQTLISLGRHHIHRTHLRLYNYNQIGAEKGLLSSWVTGKLCTVSCLLVLVLVQLGVRCQPVRQYDTLDSSKRTTMYTEIEGLVAGITMKFQKTPVYLYVEGRRSLESWTSINRLWNAVIQKCFVGSARYTRLSLMVGIQIGEIFIRFTFILREALT